MNVKKYIIASIAVYIVFMILDYVIHGVILSDTYMSMEGVWRPDMENYMWIMWVTSLVFSFSFVYIFTKGYEGKGIAEGIRYGLIIGIFVMFIGMFNQYASYPISLSLTIQWFIYGLIELMAAGAVTALIYKK